MKMRNILFLTAIAFVAIGLIGAAVTRSSFNSRFNNIDNNPTALTLDSNEITEITVTATNFNIIIMPIHDDDITITSTTGDLSTSVSNTGNHLTITARNNPDRRLFNFDFRFVHTSPEVIISLPQTHFDQLTVTNRNGRINMHGLTVTNLDLQSTNGSITLSDVETETTRLQSSNGSLNVDNVTGDLNLRTTNGGISIENVTGDIEAQTTNSRINFNNPTIEQNVDLHTTNGRIDVNLQTQPENADIRTNTSNARTELFGQNNVSTRFGDGRYNVNLRTSNGRITVQ